MIKIRFYRDGVSYTFGNYPSVSNAHLNAGDLSKYELVQNGRVIFSSI